MIVKVWSPISLSAVGAIVTVVPLTVTKEGSLAISTVASPPQIVDQDVPSESKSS